LHTIVVYDPQCPLHQPPPTSEADCAHVWDRVLTQDGTPTQRQCQRCGVIQSGRVAAPPDGPGFRLVAQTLGWHVHVTVYETRASQTSKLNGLLVFDEASWPAFRAALAPAVEVVIVDDAL
jgi:hypothetical protein